MLLAVFLAFFWGGFVGVGGEVLGVCLVPGRVTAGGVAWFCGGLAYLRMGMAGKAKSAVRTMFRDEKKALFLSGLAISLILGVTEKGGQVQLSCLCCVVCIEQLASVLSQTMAKA